MLTLLTRHWEIDDLIVVKSDEHAITSTFDADNVVCSVVDNVRVHVFLTVPIHHNMSVTLKDY